VSVEIIALPGVDKIICTEKTRLPKNEREPTCSYPHGNSATTRALSRPLPTGKEPKLVEGFSRGRIPILWISLSWFAFVCRMRCAVYSVPMLPSRIPLI